MTAKIGELNVGSKEISTTVKVVEKKDEKEIAPKFGGEAHRVAEYLVGDETGSVIMSVWDDMISQVEVGTTYNVENARITVFQNSMRLGLGRFGKLTPSETDIESVNTENNISTKHVEQPERRGFGGGGGSGGRRFGGGGGGSRFGDRDRGHGGRGGDRFGGGSRF